ncbi:PREDICTED: phosphatidylethanolamine N-methyltransferase isoform X3 [Myotis davidii]|uniref:phosphatidylethanolamine N-methyltransferase isoform X3 n=1 Tax=Myotis davidii TaxID=225400 RepID=UPI0007670BC5|nr:PREDICTED: phosphatidylethanolamine N-methyltransferase isoform X3 [Myotis davidii]
MPSRVAGQACSTPAWDSRRGRAAGPCRPLLVLVWPGGEPLSCPTSSTGDYFGILKEARVTTFPFNILDNPMYWGSTANYLGWAVMPFTAEIYRQKASQSRKSH